MTVAVVALGAGGTSCLSRFAIGGLVELAGSVLLVEGCSSLLFGGGLQSLATQGVPFLLCARVVDIGVHGASEVANFFTQARNVSV